MKKILQKIIKVSALLLFFATLIIQVIFITKVIDIGGNFEDKCGKYIYRACDSIDVETARENLAKAIEYLETSNLTSGYTSKLSHSSTQEIAPWFNNLKDCHEILENLNQESTELEKEIALKKVSNSLEDFDFPRGIKFYPVEDFYCLIFIAISGAFAIFSLWLYASL